MPLRAAISTKTNNWKLCVKQLSINIITLLIFTTSCVIAQSNISEDAKPVRVSSTPLSELVFYPEFSASAKVISLNSSQISARINAQIESIDILVGDRVQRGQKLVTLDCEDARLTQASTLAHLQLAKKEISRLQKLKAASAVTEQKVNNAQTEVSLARIAYKQATLQVARCIVTAPFTGTVVSKQASEGELASQGTPLLMLLDLDRLEVIAEVHTTDSQLLADANDFRFSVADKSYPLSIRHFSKVIDPITRKRELRLVFLNHKALIGTAGRLIWNSNSIHIPADFLIERDGQIGLFILASDHARFVVIPDAIIGHPAKISLDDNTQIVVDGRYGLRDGDRIERRGS